mmetsp:Transcript_32216/g.63476  ORF Transcript_32216/g.63476 Transcript_32216/m.63476 type:complete len:392 (+) Transcript_32216:69-1244(+)
MSPIPWWPAVTTAVCLIVGLLCHFQSRQKRRRRAAAHAREEEGSKHVPRWRRYYQDPLRWAFVGGESINEANTNPVCFENSYCKTKIMAMHRPTHEPWREETGEFPYAWHLAGRKRLWEIRMQLRFKQAPTGRVYFGLTLGGYTRVSGLARQVQQMLLKACIRVVGDLYHSNGDDPARTSGEVEPPTCVFPLWAVDQFIVSEPGQEPDLVSDLSGLGRVRTDGLRAYKNDMQSMIDNFSTEKVYTFCFWGVSQFLDCMNWEICGGILPGIRLDFNRLAGAAPVYTAMYEMPAHDKDADPRHLPSKKKYVFHVAMWSQRKPPTDQVLQDLVHSNRPFKKKAIEAAPLPRRGGINHALTLLGCCIAEPRGSLSEKRCATFGDALDVDDKMLAN